MGLIPSTELPNCETPNTSFIKALSDLIISKWSYLLRPQNNWQPQPSRDNSFFLLTAAFGTVVSAALFYLFWLISNQRQQTQQLSKENSRLLTQYSLWWDYTKDLQSKNDRLVSENEILATRKYQTENSLINLVDTIANLQKDPTATESRFLTIYQVLRENVRSQKQDNQELQKRNEKLQGQINCFICTTQPSNCFLRPCGHVLCMDCYFEIMKSSNVAQPPCPYCRNSVTEHLPIYRP